MPVSVFVDTNVLVYAYDLDAGEKREVALRIVERGWVEAGSSAISIQVLQEFYVNLQRKGRTHEEALALVNDLAGWVVVENTLALLRGALELKGSTSISFWDAMIVAAAKQSGAGILLSEDLNHGQEYGGVRVLNPFREPQQ